MPAQSLVLPVVVDLVTRKTSVDPARLRPAARLVDLGLDSVTTMELVVDLERAFDLSIPGEDLLELKTVGEVVSYVDRRLATR